MVRPSRRGKFRPLADEDASTGVVDGNTVEWDSGGYAPTPSARDQWKQPVIAATTADITIATALNDADTIDGVTLADGDRVLVKDQTLAYENGIYIVADEPYRAADFDDPEEVPGAVVLVIDGTANGGETFRAENTTPPVMDSDDITFAGSGGGGGVSISGSTPVQDGGAGSAGTGTDASADDHKHPGDKVGIIFVIDGGGSTITTGAKGVIKVPFACTITESELESDATTNTTLTIKKRAYGGGAASSIVAAALPTLSGVTENKDSTLTGWTTSVSAGDKLYWEVTTNSAAKAITSTLTATRT